MNQSKIAAHVLSKLKRLIPEALLLDCLALVVDPNLFQKEYLKAKKDVDAYAMHLLNAKSNETINSLTIEMPAGDASSELKLIAARILLSINEFSQVPSPNGIHLEQSKEFDWINWFYHNQGRMDEILT